MGSKQGLFWERNPESFSTSHLHQPAVRGRNETLQPREDEGFLPVLQTSFQIKAVRVWLWLM